MKQSVLQRVFKLRVYFLRGFGSWVTFILSAVQWLIVVYKLAVDQIPVLEAVFPSLWIFSFVSIAVGAPLCVVIGFLDYKKGSVPMESVVSTYANPWSIDIAKALYLISQGKNVEAKAILEKWVK